MYINIQQPISICIQSKNRITKLQEMLTYNRAAQDKLIKLKESIDRRKRELQEVGLIVCSGNGSSNGNGWIIGERYNQIFDECSPVGEVKRVPVELEDQLLIKKNSQAQYQFIKNLISNNQEENEESRMVFQEGMEQYPFQEEFGQQRYGAKIKDKNRGRLNDGDRNRQRYIQTKSKQKQKQRKQKQKKAKQQPNNLLLHTDPRKINFILQAKLRSKTSQLKILGIQLYREWRKIHRMDQNKKIKQLNQSRLQEKRSIYGDNWQKIGYFFNGFKFQELYNYYQKNLNKREKGKWSLRLNLVLIALIDYYGSGKWVLISKKIRQKTQYQIRQRFCNILSPTVKQIKWTPEDQKLLIQVSKQFKYKWSKIIKQVPRFATKTDNALRRKFRNIMIKKTDDQIRQEIPNQFFKLQESIIGFKKNYYNRSGKVKSNKQKYGQKSISGSKERNQDMQADQANQLSQQQVQQMQQMQEDPQSHNNHEQEQQQEQQDSLAMSEQISQQNNNDPDNIPQKIQQNDKYKKQQQQLGQYQKQEEQAQRQQQQNQILVKEQQEMKKNQRRKTKKIAKDKPKNKDKNKQKQKQPNPTTKIPTKKSTQKQNNTTVPVTPSQTNNTIIIPQIQITPNITPNEATHNDNNQYKFKEEQQMQ